MPAKRSALPKIRRVDALLTTNPAAPTRTSLLPLATRPLKPAHVEALMESIAVLGLIQLIAVDSQGVLLAGRHRREALERLQTANPEAFAEHFGAGIPVRSYDFDAAEDPDRALATEMRELADHLKAGATPLLPSLAVIVGKSERQIKRYLATDEDPAQLPRTTGWG